MPAHEAARSPYIKSGRHRLTEPTKRFPRGRRAQTLRKMSPTQTQSRLLEGWLLSVAALLPNDDVACLLLILTMFAAGADCRAWLLDGFRCDCIRTFLDPVVLEVAWRVLCWSALQTTTYISRKARAWMYAHGLSYARIPPLGGTAATLMFPSDH